MTRSSRLVVACALACVPLAASAQDKAAQDAAAPPAPGFSAEECAVWQRELAFAETVERHDAKAFAAFLHPDAVFHASSPTPQRGRDAILQRWAKIIDGTGLKLSWYPTSVVIGGEGNIAMSSGPALYESPDPKEAGKATLGGFQSTWHKGADGVWRVLFDDGIEAQPATEAEVAAFRAGRKACPRG